MHENIKYVPYKGLSQIRIEWGDFLEIIILSLRFID